MVHFRRTSILRKGDANANEHISERDQNTKDCLVTQGLSFLMLDAL